MAVVLFAYFAGLLGLQPSGAPTVLVYLPTAPAAILPDYEFWDPPFPGLCPTASAFSPDGKVLAIGNAPTGDLPPTPAIVSLFTVQATGLKEVLGPTFFETKDGFTVTSLAFNKSGNLLATANYYSLNRTVSLFIVQ
jgi:WD40 repeat protein